MICLDFSAVENTVRFCSSWATVLLSVALLADCCWMHSVTPASDVLNMHILPRLLSATHDIKGSSLCMCFCFSFFMLLCQSASFHNAPFSSFLFLFDHLCSYALVSLIQLLTSTEKYCGGSKPTIPPVCSVYVALAQKSLICRIFTLNSKQFWGHQMNMVF